MAVTYLVYSIVYRLILRIVVSIYMDRACVEVLKTGDPQMTLVGMILSMYTLIYHSTPPTWCRK